MPQEVQLDIESNCEKEDSVKDNQDQDGETHIIEDINDEDHETGRGTAAISFEQVAKDIDKYLCELIQLDITQKADTKTSMYDYVEPKSYAKA
mmetsp:Transcript_16399/g.26543  ORF Transcript_16399/g.26543 Transcript_16399/m.26543 type:complete len:93 (+) Transcript_16399:708-986(+)|eukprot:CAMPEP_0196129396 /NCGR_PEP_ID=MMETSP0910-20130528/27_1 /TAXON_ID=49265 /ORGANISM="Thalassiosira rotula, Strain GSO102" /LENGTH=92 /DNA_ID=CAMNT_0041388487 /DNA_START=776 /DNA_END=1054 /DNA_ORIENTATION=+